ncbi:uncharacterized protein LOC116617700 isoform X2 [Nematostella vectensis]|uniref:uncharacterized protein LOC116617700 isoform X2 n=1 Tax=Nematostella vectensis TaxID=45351 RepID=UPI0020777F6A|nr:uncharacterized protein LOC116617700 isoform X2 [Nematostella vectensis]
MYKNDPDQPQALAIQVEQEAGTEVTIAKPAMDQPGRDPGTELTGQSQPTVGEEESPIKSCWDFGLSGCFKFDKRERTSWIFNCQGRGNRKRLFLGDTECFASRLGRDSSSSLLHLGLHRFVHSGSTNACIWLYALV